MTDELEIALRKVAELEAENARLRDRCRALETACDELGESRDELNARWQAAVGHSLETAEALAESEDPKP